jgi:DNA-binding XRE family transcriptional regulator
MTQRELKKWRLKHSLTQEELGKKLGVTNVCIYRWEAGYRHIPPFLHLALKWLENEGGESKKQGKKRTKKKEVKKKDGYRII